MSVTFRLRPSAAIIRDGSILLIEYDEPGVGLHYNLPGGGLQPDEAVYEGLKRELREEALAEIVIGPLLMVWELPHNYDGVHHHLGLVFRCDLADGSQPHRPEPGDPFQTGVRWVPMSELAHIRLLPEVMARKLVDILQTPVSVDLFVAGQW